MDAQETQGFESIQMGFLKISQAKKIFLNHLTSISKRELYFKKKYQINLQKVNSPTGTRTRVFRVKTWYPNQLDYWGVVILLIQILQIYQVPNMYWDLFSQKDCLLVQKQAHFGQKKRRALPPVLYQVRWNFYHQYLNIMIFLFVWNSLQQTKRFYSQEIFLERLLLFIFAWLSRNQETWSSPFASWWTKSLYFSRFTS